MFVYFSIIIGGRCFRRDTPTYKSNNITMEQNTTKIWQAVLIIVVLAVIGGLVLTANYKKSNPSTGDDSSNSNGNSTSAHPAAITFAPLTTKYVKAVDWPPKVQIVNEKFSCTEAGLETDRAGITEKKVIGGTTYCVTRESEGAAGTTYTQYAYARANAGKTEIFTFSLGFPQCANYDGASKTECEKEEAALTPDNFFLPIASTSQNTNATTQNLCYIWNTEAGDKAQLSLAVLGSSVTGKFNWLPAEKDRKTGSFVGSVSVIDPKTGSQNISGWWSVSAEGMKTTEEIKIKFNDKYASVGFGEMKDRGDGTYVYAHPESLSYVPTLSATDCSDSAMK